MPAPIPVGRGPAGDDRIRQIDHLVFPVTTLMLARLRLTGLGFTVAADARHPFGTGNCCVFFRDRTCLEPITILDRTLADMAAAEGFAFVKRLKRFTERQGEGFAMVALRSGDAEADRVLFEKAGVGSQSVHRFSRMARLPDGSEREVGFVVTFADFPAAPDATFFVCQHLAADVLFQPGYLEHANGAVGISAVVAVAEKPDDFRAMLSTATGQQEVETSDGGLEAKVNGQSLVILSRENFRARYDIEPPSPRRGLLFAAVEIEVLDLDRAKGYAGSAARRREDAVVVPAAPGFGAVIAYRRGANA